MGKLHRIKKAFNRLSDEEKQKLCKYRKPCVRVRNGKFEFQRSYYCNSYMNYIKKLCREYLAEVALGDLTPGQGVEAEVDNPAKSGEKPPSAIYSRLVITARYIK